MIFTLLAQARTGVDLSGEYKFGGVNSLAEGLGYLIGPMFEIAGIAVVIYFLYGAIKFLFSGGDKEGIKSGKDMIVHGIIGLFLLVMMFLVLQYIPSYFGLTGFKIIGSTP
jgi:hypothetical protein